MQIDGCVISRDLNRSQKIVLNFHSEIRPMTEKCSKAGYPQKFIETNIWDFTAPLDKDESFIIPPESRTKLHRNNL